MPRNFRKKSNALKSLEKDVKMLKREAGADKGILQVRRNSTSSANVSWYHTSYVTEAGTGLENRDGLSISAQSVQIKGLLTREDADGNMIRLMAVQFESYADADIANFLQNPTSEAAYPRQALFTPYKVDGDCKYRVLFDKTYTIPTIKTEVLINENIRIPRKNNIMKYTQELSQNPQTNTVVWYTVSDSLVVTHPSLSVHFRERFSK